MLLFRGRQCRCPRQDACEAVFLAEDLLRGLSTRRQSDVCTTAWRCELHWPGSRDGESRLKYASRKVIQCRLSLTRYQATCRISQVEALCISLWSKLSLLFVLADCHLMWCSSSVTSSFRSISVLPVWILMSGIRFEVLGIRHQHLSRGHLCTALTSGR